MAGSARFERAAAIFEDALDHPPEARAGFLAEACGDDAALRAEVESLLEHDTCARTDFLASPAVVLRREEPSAPEWVLALVGRKIGRYTIVRVLGHGGMGCVFEARQEKPARSVALKVLAPGSSAPSALARFRLEPELLGRLRHSNIAQVFEAGVHEDAHGTVPYFAMEFIPDAQHLLEYADVRGLTTRQRLELFAKVCDAIHHGHQKGIVHRDIKPANILVGADGEPKVIDFGVARASDADIVMTTQCTHVGDLVGTVHYMSPEQCDGNPAAIDTRSDIYSLGVVLYELLTGLAPYDTSGTTLYNAIRVIKEQPPRQPSLAIGQVHGAAARRRHLARELRGDLDAVLSKALEKEPARRYVSAADLAQDIRRHLAGEPVEARRASAWRRVLRWAGRRPRTAATLGTLALCASILLGAVGGATAYWSYFMQAPDRIAYDNEQVRRQAHLLNRQGTPIYTWDAGPNGRVYAELIQPYPDNPRRKYVLVGFSSASAPDRACQLWFCDTRDANRPLWSRRLAWEHLPDAVREKGMTPEQFQPANIWMMDVFTESQPPRRDEIVCQFVHNLFSYRALCIFDLQGDLLYSAWHDGDIFDCYWMSGPRILVLSASNWELDPHERGCSNAAPNTRMLVVFALRPEGGPATPPTLLDSATAGTGGELVWYKWLGVCPFPNVQWHFELQPPPDGDSSSSVEVSISIPNLACAISWRIGADGSPLSGLVCSTYEMARNLDPNLPPPEDFLLQDHPPGS